MKIRRRQALLRQIELGKAQLQGTAVYKEMLALQMKPIFLLNGRTFDSECDYADVVIKDDILYGRPVIWAEEDKEDGDIEFYDERSIPAEPILYPEKMHKWIGGLPKDSFVNVHYGDLIIPGSIKVIEEDAFRNSKCDEELIIPSHLLPQLTRSGLLVTPGCTVRVNGTGSFGNPLKDKDAYIAVFDKNDKIKINDGKLLYYKDRSKQKEMITIPFDWYKFFKTKEQLVNCLIMAKYNIAICNDTTQAIMDLIKLAQE